MFTFHFNRITYERFEIVCLLHKINLDLPSRAPLPRSVCVYICTSLPAQPLHHPVTVPVPVLPVRVKLFGHY